MPSKGRGFDCLGATDRRGPACPEPHERRVSDARHAPRAVLTRCLRVLPGRSVATTKLAHRGVVGAVLLASLAAALVVPSARPAGGTLRSVVLLSERSRGWVAIDVDSGARGRVWAVNYFNFERSPDGSRVAYPCTFAPGDGDNHAVCIGAVQGPARKIVLRHRDRAGRPDSLSSVQWSHDGRQLSYLRETAKGNEAWAVRADGTHRRLLPTEGNESAWSPDGARLAYAREQPGQDRGIFVVGSAGTAPARRIARGNGDVYALRWSPRGAWISYVLDAPGLGADGIYVVRPDGRQRHRIAAQPFPSAGGATNAPYFSQWVGWSADERSLAYTNSPDVDPVNVAYVVDVAGGRSTRIGEGKVLFSPAGRSFLLTTDDGRMSLFRNASWTGLGLSRQGAHGAAVRRVVVRRQADRLRRHGRTLGRGPRRRRAPPDPQLAARGRGLQRPPDLAVTPSL